MTRNTQAEGESTDGKQHKGELYVREDGGERRAVYITWQVWRFYCECVRAAACVCVCACASANSCVLVCKERVAVFLCSPPLNVPRIPDVF